MRLGRQFSIILPLMCLLPALIGFTSYGHANDKEADLHSLAHLNQHITRIIVKVRDLPDYEVELADLARNLIVLREGDRFSPDLLQESIEALKISKRFREIHVDSEREKEGIALLFHLKAFRLIKDITIYGEFPLFEREILKAMTTYVGEVYIHEELHKQAALIAEVIKGEGFPNPKVEVTATEDPEDGNFIVHVDIDKGPYRALARLDIVGNRAFSDMTLKSRMKTWRALLLPGSSGRFIGRDLDRDIKKLTSFYRKRGYPDVIIDHKIMGEPAVIEVSVFITIDEGSRYEVEFRGNEAFGEDALRKDLVLFREGNKNDLGLRKSVKAIKDRYRMAGFLEAKVKIEEQKRATGEDETIRMIRFVINEGPQTIVNSIQFSGNKAFDDTELKKQMLTRVPGVREKGIFVPEILEDDISAIKSLYRKHGYMDTEIVKEVKWSADKRNVEITLEIEEKVRTLVASVEVIGITAISGQEAYNAIQMSEEEPFRSYMMQSDENALSAVVSKKGYPHVKVKGEVSISEDRSKARVTYYVDEGPRAKMGHVHYMGNFKTKKRILQREFQMAPGEPFSLEKMLQSQRSIRNMGIFNSVRFRAIGLREKREEVQLLVDVEEKKPYFIQAGGGYETNRGFYLHARGGDRNLFGTNKDAWMAGEVSQIGYRSELGITEPRLFGTRIATTFGLYSERREEFNQDFGTRSLGSSLGFSRKWFRHITTGLNFRFERREQFITDPTGDTAYFEDEDMFKPRSILVTTPSIRYDTRDSFIRPRKGILSSLSVDVSKGIRNSLDDLFKYRYDLRLYTTPIDRLTFAWLGRAGYIDPFGPAERIPDDQLFYLGGTSDVRGFRENMLRIDPIGSPVGGRSMVAGSVEARIDLGHNVEFTLFYDVGYVGSTYAESVSDDTRSSVGVGLRYITPVGPIGFLYGIKLEPEEGESPGRLHFSIGYTF
jgi:outer membrane protein insertion porin family